ncbi:hypothetical protein NQ317_019742 [Molorchus minor]|uniref:GP-PDE domain-containing protein n=1 Tax=Molorchus minor TaxID=1323400 RepID=A0ABQ9K5B3_9CUCU|nr:hypothetical protein NQ317_019742 [Molorchus minor]
MKPEFLGLIPSALTIIYVTYGSWFLIKEIFCSIIPFTLVFTVLIVAAICLLRVPLPEASAVEAVLGKEALDAGASDYVMKTIAHRGAGLDAPENSLQAFKLCNEKGCDAIEFDVRLTNDEIPIVFHDTTLERMTDLNLVISDSKWEELANIDISIKHPFRDRFANTNIPTLDQAVSQMLACGQRMFIDIKDNNTKVVPIIVELYTKYPDLISRAVVTSFYPNIIYLIRKKNPKIIGCLAWRPYNFTSENFRYPDGPGPRKSDVWYKHYFLQVCDNIHTWALPRITFYLLGISVVLLHKDALSG